MKILTKEQLQEIRGGASLSASMIKAINDLVKIIINIGELFGSALRRIETDEICPIK